MERSREGREGLMPEPNRLGGKSSRRQRKARGRRETVP